MTGAQSDIVERLRWRFIFSGCGICVVSLLLTILSQWFSYDQSRFGKPHLVFFGLMSVGFVLNMVGLHAAVCLRRDAVVRNWLLLFGLVARLLLLPSHPIQEVDIYRYVWDGAVLAEGGNPFQFSPRDVLAAQSPMGDRELDGLCVLKSSSESLHRCLSRIHYPHLTTIYPPVSQVVFAAAAIVTPNSVSLPVRRTVMKVFIVLFDMLTLLGLIWLLQKLGKPPGWAVVYAWSPLVLKEFANSGHLDAIAIAFATWAVAFWVVAVQERSNGRLLAAAALLGLGVGAKLYPVVMVPVIVVSVWRTFGARWVFATGMVFLVVSATSLAPMLTSTPKPLEVKATSQVDMPEKVDVPTLLSNDSASTEQVEHMTPPLIDELTSANSDPPLPDDFDVVVANKAPVYEPTPKRKADAAETGDGLSAFMQRWRMNDFIFKVIHENLRRSSRAWFVIVPEAVRTRIVSSVMEVFSMEEPSATFAVARSLTVVVHLAIVAWLSVLAFRVSPRRLPGLAFLCIAWFWYLLPTQNPWYWIWAMPLLPFVRQRSWLLVAGLAVIYYLRFWLRDDFGDGPVLGTSYSGGQFFAYVVVWIEHLPVLLLLAWECWGRRRRKSSAA